MINCNEFDQVSAGSEMHRWAEDLYPICRSLTGDGVRETFDYIKKIIPDMVVKSVPSGYRAFDWEVPPEWNIRAAYIEDEFGNRIVDFANHNLHVVGYSQPVDRWIDKNELEKHLFSLPEQPEAIPYVTSYYNERWGFCMSHQQRETLKDCRYHVVIDSDIGPGVMNYGEVILPGEVDKEIFLSTYICHPSMGNNELSGPVVTTNLIKWLMSLDKRYYTYRIVFVPETIGSLVYLSKNLDYMKDNIVAGFNVTCVGDDNNYSFLPSRNGTTISDLVGRHVLEYSDYSFKEYSWLDRGSDERQYCAPGVDLPIATVMRSKYGTYPEYHTSLDNLDYISPAGLGGGAFSLVRCLTALENNFSVRANYIGEPQLGKRGLYPNVSVKNSSFVVRTIMDVLSMSDGRSLLELASSINRPFWDVYPVVRKLEVAGLLTLTRE